MSLKHEKEVGHNHNVSWKEAEPLRTHKCQHKAGDRWSLAPWLCTASHLPFKPVNHKTPGMEIQKTATGSKENMLFSSAVATGRRKKREHITTQLAQPSSKSTPEYVHPC